MDNRDIFVSREDLYERLEQQRLEAEIQRERLASGLRSFVQACEAEFSGRNSTDAGARAKTWLRWAYEHADRIDPLRNGYLEQVLNPHQPT